MEIVVGPGVSAAAISAFSVPITEGSSMKIAQGQRPAAGARELDPAIAVDPGAEVLEGVEVGVEAAAADEVAPGGGIRASPKRASSGPASRNEARICFESSSSTATSETAGGAEANAVVGNPGDLDPEPLEQGDLRFGVANPRHPVKHQLLLGQQAGGEDRQRRVLVSGNGELARERHAAFDDEFLHRFRLG